MTFKNTAQSASSSTYIWRIIDNLSTSFTSLFRAMHNIDASIIFLLSAGNERH